MKIQITLILENAQPVTAVADDWDDAIAEIARWFTWDQAPGGYGPIGRDLPVYLCDTDRGLPIFEQHTVGDCLQRHYRRVFAHGATERQPRQASRNDGPPYDAATATGMYDGW